MYIELQAVDKSLMVLEDDELRLELSLGLPYSLQFYYFIYDKQNNCVGNCGIRLFDDEKYKYLGNIEYEIFEQYRGNNYASKACNLLSKVALFYNVDKITITAEPSNLASNKTIQKLGARFIEVRKVPKNMSLHKTAKHVNAYEWNLESEKKI
ncbi:MAG: GNAT family N-acetyltransferase [Bacilli bacterium]|nr:GNAT family N-acetyltransferase [Bacilli bacterium]